jgi:hypothetical protein
MTNTLSGTFQVKRRRSGPGAPASLKSGEMFHNEAEQIVYVGVGDDGNGLATSIIPLTGPGAVLAQFTSVVAALPTSLPATAGKLWLNGGVLAIS